MEQINALRETLPESARDIKLNLSAVLQPGALNADQVWGTALACAYAARNPKLTQAVLADATAAGISAGALEDAKAAAILMSQNNIFYRFRHAIGKDSYAEKPARLRMLRLNQVASNKADMDLFSFAVSAINFCQACMNSHEEEALKHGLSEDQVHDAVRIASVIHAAAVALEVG
jgi:alkyl hydroperoxide reductase subunit D